MKRVVLFLLAAGMVTVLCAAQKPTEETAKNDSLPAFNKIVLQMIKQYPTDGTHGYWWPRGKKGHYSGSSQDLFFQGEKVMTGDPKGRTFCCGLTLEVFLRSYEKWLGARGGEKDAAFTANEWSKFQKLWFVEKLDGPGPSAALEAFHLGKEIPPSEALPGDFVQIWRTKNKRGHVSGHSVIFLNWVKSDNGHVIGFRYWSTQTSTKGIHENTEYYGPLGGLSTEYTYFGRVEPRTKDESVPKKAD